MAGSFIPWQTILETCTSLPVWGRQLWRRTTDFLLIFLRFYVYGLRFKVWGPTTFLTEFQTLTPKNVIHGTSCIISFLTCYLMSWTHISEKKNHWSLISPRTVFSDLALWCCHSWSVTSCKCKVVVSYKFVTSYLLIVLARPNWHKGDFH